VRLALITPLVDPADPLLGFIHTWVERLANRVEHLSVIQLWRSNPPLPGNVTLYSLDRSGPGGKVAALARMACTLADLCWRRKVDGVIAHMGPIFAVCAAPIAKPAGVPLALWYAHGTVSPMLRLAHALVDRAGTSTPDGFRIPSRKITITGQGIDTRTFVPNAARDERLIVSIGRVSPIKRYETAIDAMAILRQQGMTDVRLRIVGGATLPNERRYRNELEGQIKRLELSETVTLAPGVPHNHIVREYQEAGLFVSCSQTGSLDKAVLEAASCGCLPVTSNPALRAFFRDEHTDHMPPTSSAQGVADLLTRWLIADPSQRDTRAAVLRERVEREHSVDHLADELVQLVQRVKSSPSDQPGSTPVR
jgi:glycosyltransferase involved in cell wall biosynthesis